jgi:hypothetical protein
MKDHQTESLMVIELVDGRQAFVQVALLLVFLA